MITQTLSPASVYRADERVHPIPSSVRVPFRFVNGFIVVDVLFQRSLPLSFIIDTGAEFTILIHREVTDLFRIPYGREYRLLGADMQTPVSAWLVRGIDLSLQDLDLRNRDMLVLQDDYFRLDFGTGMPIHGILGADILHRYVITIDYRRKHLTFSHPSRFRLPPGYDSVPVSIRRNKPFILASYQSSDASTAYPISLLFDTGASLTALFHSGTHEALPNLPPGQEGIVGIGLGGFIFGARGISHGLDLGPFRLQNLPSNFQDVSSFPDTSLLHGRNGILGNKLMQRFSVVLDYPNGRLYLKPGKEFYEPPTPDKSGLFILASGRKLKTYIVHDVVVGSPASD